MIDGLARGQSGFESVEVRFGHRPIAFGREQQSHIHVDARGDQLADRRQARLRSRDLDHHIGALEAAPQPLAFGDARGTVVRYVRRHLEAHEAVATGCLTIEPGEQVRGSPYVLDGERLIQRLARGDAGESFLYRRSVLRLLHHRGGEDGWVRCHTSQAIVRDEAGEAAIGEHRASQVVEPDALAQLAQL